MTLYEKIMELRKRKGLSQEELGAEIGVSRQAVSKWEMAQTTPDLNKIMALADLFGVSTDFLLKDEYDLTDLERENKADMPSAGIEAADTSPAKSNRFIDLQEVQEYLTLKRLAAKRYALSLVLVFISPFAGLIMGSFNENMAIIGAVIQIVVLIIAAVIIVTTLWSLSKYKYLKAETNELAYGIHGIVEKYREEFARTYLMGIIIGVICIIGCVLPMMVVSAFTSYNDFVIAIGGCFMLLIFSLGLSSIVYVVTISRGYKLFLKIK